MLLCQSTLHLKNRTGYDGHGNSVGHSTIMMPIGVASLHNNMEGFFKSQNQTALLDE